MIFNKTKILCIEHNNFNHVNRVLVAKEKSYNDVVLLYKSVVSHISNTTYRVVVSLYKRMLQHWKCFRNVERNDQ